MRRKAKRGSEDQHQRLVAEYLDALGVLWAHPPNEGKRSLAAGRKLRAHGLKRGLPDVLIFDPPTWPYHRNRVGTAIELKRPDATGRTLDRERRWTCASVTPDQSAWLAQLQRRGWSCWVAFGLPEVVEICRWLGYDKAGAPVRSEPQHAGGLP